MRDRLSLACLLLAVVWLPRAHAAPLATVPLSRQAPAIDGKLSPGEWDQAAGLGLFTVKGALATEQPEVYLACDGRTFFVGARFPLPQGAKPVAVARARDGALWEDDALEVFLSGGDDAAPYHQFIVNAANSHYEGERQNAAWQGEWTSATFVGVGFWSLEMAIPLSTLKASAADGQTWRANFAWDCKTPSTQMATWAAVSSSLHETSTFGQLTFNSAAPAVQLFGPRLLPDGKLQFTGRASGPATGKVVLSRKAGNDVQTVAEEKAELGPGGSTLTVAV
ncbi:MAG: sugar-binding protein, partial [Armatimonadota bacterium]